jgi:uncharacterized damage-inducible protein DinB
LVTSLLADAFGHHGWATLRVLDVCADLSPDQLGTSVPGTYGSILDTLKHTVGADVSYLVVLTGGERARIDEDVMSVPELRREMEIDAETWNALVATELDPDEILVRHRDDGSETYAPRGVRLAQALHHGTDHRSQICTALTSLGIEPPAIDVWDFADSQGRLREVPPTA